MPRKRKKEQIVCTYFIWLLGQRDGVYVADGRSNKLNLGRHSLGTRNREQALAALQRLDLVKAVENDLADRRLLDGAALPAVLGLEEGRQLYEAYVRRPRVTRGARPGTPKRYRAVFDKFLRFARGEGITAWNSVTAALLQRYAAWLQGEEYAYRTQYLELTTLKQAIKWLVQSGSLAGSSIIHLPLCKPEGTDTHCWRREEVDAVLAYCREQPRLAWLSHVILALACTGLRISELAALRWSDISWENNMILLTDESTQAPRKGRRKTREIKNRHSRSFPIYEDLGQVLKALPRSSDGLIFHGPRGGHLKGDTVRDILVRKVLSPLAERFPTPKGEIGFEDGRLHSFRHYFCSICANSGVPEQVVMQWLGHAESKMVRHYYHLHNDEAQRQMKRVNFFGEAGSTGAAGQVS
jgi:integrase